MINDLMVISLVGELGFTDIMAGLPGAFFGMLKTDQDSLWLAVIGRINDGTRDIPELANFAREWVNTLSQTSCSHYL